MVYQENTINNMPFIKLFRTPLGYYFFDVNRDMVCPIDKKTYYELEKIIKNGFANSVSSEIKLLKETGWLSNNRPKMLKHPATDTIEYWLQHNLYQLVLQVTQNCNLSCVYCPYAINKDGKLSRTHTNKVMDFTMAKKAIDFLAKNSDETNEVAISFYGGEPLLVYPLIKKCVEYAKNIFDGKDIIFNLSTNATLLSDEMIDYFAKNRFFLLFSLDGPKSIQDKNRVRADGSSTYRSVIEALKKAIEKYEENSKSHILVNVVINTDNSLDKIVNWLNDPVFKKITVQTGLVEDDYLEKKFEINPDFSEKYQYLLFVELLNYLKIVPNLQGNIMTSAEVRRSSEIYSSLQSDGGSLTDLSNPGGPCLSGVKKIFVNCEGKIFPCEKVNELSDSMCIGNLQSGFNVEKVKAHLNIAQLTPEKCKNCWVQRHCGVCQRRADGGQELSAKEKNKFCEITKNSFFSELQTITLIKESKTIYRAKNGGNSIEKISNLSHN